MDLAALARRFYSAAWGQGRLEVVDEICGANVTDHHHRLQGRGSMRGVISQLRGTFPDLQIVVERQVVDGDHVASHLRFQGTDKGGLFAMEPTGRTVDFSALFIDRFVDGQLEDHWGVSDMMAVFRQLEIIPPGWQANRPLVA